MPEGLLGQPIGLVPASLLKADLCELRPGVTLESVEIVLLVERYGPLEVGHRELVLPDLLEASPEVPECTTDLEVVPFRTRELHGPLERLDAFQLLEARNPRGAERVQGDPQRHGRSHLLGELDRA